MCPADPSNTRFLGPTPIKWQLQIDHAVQSFLHGQCRILTIGLRYIAAYHFPQKLSILVRDPAFWTSIQHLVPQLNPTHHVKRHTDRVSRFPQYTLLVTNEQTEGGTDRQDDDGTRPVRISRLRYLCDAT